MLAQQIALRGNLKIPSVTPTPQSPLGGFLAAGRFWKMFGGRSTGRSIVDRPEIGFSTPPVE